MITRTNNYDPLCPRSCNDRYDVSGHAGGCPLRHDIVELRVTVTGGTVEIADGARLRHYAFLESADDRGRLRVAVSASDYARVVSLDGPARVALLLPIEPPVKVFERLLRAAVATGDRLDSPKSPPFGFATWDAWAAEVRKAVDG